MRKLLYISILALLLSACSTPETSVLPQELVPQKEINAFNDTIFFADVFSLNESNGEVFMSLKGAKQIAHLDNEMNLKKLFITQGKGPTEIPMVNRFCIYNNEIYLGDYAQMKLQKFSINGEYIAPLNGTESNFSLKTRFWIEQDMMYFGYSDVDSLKSLRSLNLKTGEFKAFGAMTKFENGYKTYNQNIRDVFVYKNKIIAVQKGLSAVEVYDKNTLELKQTKQLTDLVFVNEIYQAMSDKMKNAKNGGYQFFIDSYLHDNILYLLVLDWKTGDKAHILALDINKELKLVKHYTTPDVLTTICVDDQYIYGVPSAGKLIRYFTS